jgi:hypothetical protein
MEIFTAASSKRKAKPIVPSAAGNEAKTAIKKRTRKARQGLLMALRLPDNRTSDTWPLKSAEATRGVTKAGGSNSPVRQFSDHYFFKKHVFY